MATSIQATQTPIEFQATLTHKVKGKRFYRRAVTEQALCQFFRKDDQLVAEDKASKTTLLSLPISHVVGLEAPSVKNPTTSQLLSFSGEDAEMKQEETCLTFDSQQKLTEARAQILESRYGSRDGLKAHIVQPVVNPYRSSGKGSEIWKGTERSLRAAGMTILPAYITVADIAATAEFVRQQRAEPQSSPNIPTTYLVVGGDGTTKAVAEGLTDNGKYEATASLGVIPIGGNHGVAATLDLKKNDAHAYAAYSFLNASAQVIYQPWYPICYQSFNRDGVKQEQGLSLVGIDGGFLAKIDLATTNCGATKTVWEIYEATKFFARPTTYTYSVTQTPAAENTTPDFIEPTGYYLISAFNSPYSAFRYVFSPESDVTKPEFVHRTIIKDCPEVQSVHDRGKLVTTFENEKSDYEKVTVSRVLKALTMEKADPAIYGFILTADGQPLEGHKVVMETCEHPLKFVALNVIGPKSTSSERTSSESIPENAEPGTAGIGAIAAIAGEEEQKQRAESASGSQSSSGSSSNYEDAES